uniref:mRNA decay activator protein ZFP36 n=1 Tax=Oryzias latipes TaxID=8090 RepID=A0A286P9S4_ORYLA|nr:zinc finger protein 36, C3H1 type-like 2 [Oryzias latipes]
MVGFIYNSNKLLPALAPSEPRAALNTQQLSQSRTSSRFINHHGSPTSALTNKMSKSGCYRDGGMPQQKPDCLNISANYKTKLCWFFAKNGVCKYGGKCRYAHGYGDLRSLQLKMNLCHHFYKGRPCLHGGSCGFIHNSHQLLPAQPTSEPRAALNKDGYRQMDVSPPQQLSQSLTSSGFFNHRGPSTVNAGAITCCIPTVPAVVFSKVPNPCNPCPGLIPTVPAVVFSKVPNPCHPCLGLIPTVPAVVFSTVPNPCNLCPGLLLLH